MIGDGMNESLAIGTFGAAARRAVANMSLALVLAAGAAQVAAAEPKEGQKFGDWAVKCPAAAPAKEGAAEPPAKPLCFLFQGVILTKDGKKQQIMKIVVGYRTTGGDPVVNITVPLGVFLPAGYLFQVDQGQPLRVNFVTCLVNGCQGRFALDKKYLATVQRGLKGKVVFEDRSRKKLSLPVSLIGFTAGLAALN